MAQAQKFAAISCLVASVSMVATPALAADVRTSAARSETAPGSYDVEASNAQNHRYYRYRHHRHGVDAGDVLAGVLILGGIAAIASAANKKSDERYRAPDDRDRPYDYRERRGDSRYDNARGIDRAVSICVNHIERDVRVETVDGVDRSANGWRVTGTLFNGEGFTCRIGEDGRIDDVDYGGYAMNTAPRPASEDRQHSDARYAAAWRDLESQPRPMVEENGDEARPAYPGGPIDGDLAGEGDQDDRYRIAAVPAD